MPRRATHIQVEKHNQLRPDRVRGMGDVVFKGFECLNPECDHFMFVREDEINEYFEIECGACGFVHKYGSETKFYDYELRNLEDARVIESGEFAILHDDYIAEAGRYKCCIVCGTLKPLDFFDRHGARESGRQGECRLCKRVYNSIKNQTRTADQHREAAQKRRLYVELTATGKIDSKAIYERFGHRCFVCGKDLSGDLQTDAAARGGNLDHTLPVKYLWPMTTDNATLLCKRHNAEKAEKWPGEFYGRPKLRELVVKTGVPYEVLIAAPHFNPDALERLHNADFVEQLLQKYAAYIDEIIHLRNRVLRATSFDFFKSSTRISTAWIRRANKAL